MGSGEQNEVTGWNEGKNNRNWNGVNEWNEVRRRSGVRKWKEKKRME